MFTCQLCQQETCYVYKYCDTCQNVKRIMNCYGAKEVLAILNRVCLRNTQQQDYKITKELKESFKKSLDKIKDKDVDKTDASYETPITRNKKKTASM